MQKKKATNNVRTDLDNNEHNLTLNQLPFIIVKFDINGTINYANDNFYHFINSKSKKKKTTSFYNYLSDDELKIFKELLNESALSITAIRTANKLFNDENDFGWFSWTINPIVNDKNELIEYIAAGEDITSKYQDHEKLSYEEELSKKIIENNPTIICRVSGDGTTNYLNPAGEKITGYAQVEILGNNWWDILFPEKLNEQVIQLFDLLANGDIENYEMTLLDKNGINKTVSWSTLLRFDKKGKIFEIILFGNDITEKKNVLDEIQNRLNVERTTSMISNLFVGAYDIDECITFTLQLLGNQCKAERVFIVMNDQQSATITNTHEWTKHGSAAEISTIQQLPKNNLSNIFKKIKNVDCISDTSSEIKNEISHELEIIKLKNKSFLIIPFNIDEKPLGFLALDTKSNNEKFNADDISVCQMAAQIISNAWEKDQAQRRLFIHEQHLSKAQENAKLGSWEWDYQNEKMIWSEEMFRLFDFNKIRFTGTIKDWQKLPIVPEDKQKVFYALRALIEEYIPQQIEFKVKKGTGQIVTLQAKSEIIFNSLRNPARVFGTLQDITELKKYQEALRNNEEKIARIIDTIPNPIFYKDDEGRYIGCNKAFEEFVGKPKEKIINKTVYDITQRQLAEVYHEADIELVKERGDSVYEAKVPHSSGEYKDIIFYKSTLLDKDGNGIGLVGVMHDITDRKAMENSLRDNERIIRQIIDSVPHMIYAKDSNGKFIFANKSFAQAYSKTTSEIRGKKHEEFHKNISETELKSFLEIDSMILKNNSEVSGIEEAFTDSNGHHHIIESHKLPFNFHGEQGILSVAADITDKRFAYEALRQSEERYRMLIENNFDMICETDVEAKFLYVNNAYTVTLGYQSYELIGKNIFELVHPDDLPPLLEEFRKDKGSATFRYRHKNGSWHWLESKGKKFETEDSITKAVIISRDITEQKLATEQIKKSEKNYREIFETSQDAIFILDPENLTILDANRSASLQYGYEYSQLIGQRISELSYNKAPYTFEKSVNWDDLMDLKEFQTLEWLDKSSDGTLFWTEKIIQSTIINNNKRFLVVSRDIAERKKIDLVHKAMFDIAITVNKSSTLEEFFMALQKELGKILNARNILVELYDEKKDSTTLAYQSDEKHIYATTTNKKTLGNYIVKNNISLLLKEDEILEMVSKGEIEILKSVPKCFLGLPLRVSDKIIGVIILQSYDNENAYKPEDFNFLEFVSIQVSGAIVKKQNEERIRTLSLSVEQSPANIIITDTNGVIEYVNPKFEQMTGYEKKFVIGKRTNILSAGKTKPETYEKLWDAITQGGVWYGELLNKRTSGEEYWESKIISPIRNAAGIITHYMSIGEDITSAKEIQQKLIDAKLNAEEANKLKNEFLAQMSHEVRTPINTILSFTSLLKNDIEDKVSDDLKSGFIGINHAGKRLIRTIDLILDMAQIQSGTYEKETAIFDLYEDVLKSIYFEYRQQAIEKGLELILDDNKIPMSITADEYTVQQIFSNLVDNAIKYTNTGYIKITSENLTDRFIITVEDTGIGISKEYLPYLFDSFSQEDQGYTRRFEGNGLGLALVKNYCHINNAEIKAESEKDKWTKFIVTFKI